MTEQPVLDFLPDSPLKDATLFSCPLSALPDYLIGKEPDKAFVENVRTFGILSPIWLQDSGSAYLVLAGRRRIKAARSIGLTEIPALLFPPQFDPNALALIENRQRDTNPISDLEAVKTLMGRGHSEKDIGKALGINLSSVKRLLALSTLPEPVYEAVKQGDVAIGVAEKFARLTPLQQARVLETTEAARLTADVVHDARRVELKEATGSLLPDLAPVEEDETLSLPKELAGRILDAAMYEALSARDWVIRLIERELTPRVPSDKPRLRVRKPPQPVA